MIQEHSISQPIMTVRPKQYSNLLQLNKFAVLLEAYTYLQNGTIGPNPDSGANTLYSGLTPFNLLET